ncbi:MAG: hypothetical protein MJ252_09275 [archaeon]|nr:hypothetical protein [archaeon]
MNQEKNINPLIVPEEKNEEEDNVIIPPPKEGMTKGMKAIIYISLSLILSVITNIFFKAATISYSPIYIAYFQSLAFLVFLPFSFVTIQSENLFYKKNKSEQEVTEKEMIQVMDDDFSEIMEKRFYENYYRYYKGYYKNALILTVLYMASHLLYYICIAMVDPIFCICVHSGVGFCIDLIKLTQKGIKFETFNLLSMIFATVIIVYSLCMYILTYELKGDYKILGIIFLILSDLLFAFFLTQFKLILKKFKYYIKLGEFAGYFGLFSTPFIFVILILKACISKKDLFAISASTEFLGFIFLSALSDYFLFQFLNNVTRSTFSNNFGIEVCLLLILLKGRISTIKEIFQNPFLYIEIVLLIIGVVLSFLNFNESERKKIERKKIVIEKKALDS